MPCAHKHNSTTGVIRKVTVTLAMNCVVFFSVDLSKYGVIRKMGVVLNC